MNEQIEALTIEKTKKLTEKKRSSLHRIGEGKKIDKEKIKKTIDIPSFLEKSKSHFFNQAVIEALAHLVLKLKENINSYDTILSDDASGRLVSLLLRKIINQQREKTGKKRIKTYFLAAGRSRLPAQIDALREFIISKKRVLGKTLLVTEYISEGRGITYLVKMLKKEGTNFDVATVSITHNPKIYNYDQDLISRLKYGLAKNNIGMTIFYYQAEYSGIGKSYSVDSAHPVLAEFRDKRLMKQVRQDIDTLAKELSKLLD